MFDPTKIAQTARQYCGVPWRHQGRNPETGLDCVGLCIATAANLGIHFVGNPAYARSHDGSELIATLGRFLIPVRKENWRTGDVGLFKESGYPVHLGFLAIKAGARTVIHAHARRRKVVEETLDGYGHPYLVYRLEDKT
jgi:cell wall-associated NlpC family hydrolase